MRVGSKARWPSAGSFTPTLLHEDEESAEHWHRPPATAGMRAVIQRNVKACLNLVPGKEGICRELRSLGNCSNTPQPHSWSGEVESRAREICSYLPATRFQDILVSLGDEMSPID